jgi:hypothetical protein
MEAGISLCFTMTAAMNGWYYFWMTNFVVAGSAFAVITLIVLVRGLRDLREMFAGLRAEAQRPR